jgi:hypothetical protein
MAGRISSRPLEGEEVRGGGMQRYRRGSYRS